MAAFQFRLDKVLDWRRKQFEQEQGRLAECLASLERVRQAIRDLQSERLAVGREIVSRGTLAATDLVALERYRLRAKKEEFELNLDRERREAAARESRERLQAAQRRVRLLEKLRERRLEEHTYAAARELEDMAADAYLAKWCAR